MTWNPFRRRGEILRARRNEEIERQVREALTASASDPSAAVDPRDRAAFVRRIKAVLAA